MSFQIINVILILLSGIIFRNLFKRYLDGDYRLESLNKGINTIKAERPSFLSHKNRVLWSLRKTAFLVKILGEKPVSAINSILAKIGYYGAIPATVLIAWSYWSSSPIGQ